MIRIPLGKGWKTLTGVVMWGIGNAGVISSIIPGADSVLTKVGAALAIFGIAHKIERNDPTTPSR